MSFREKSSNILQNNQLDVLISWQIPLSDLSNWIFLIRFVCCLMNNETALSSLFYTLHIFLDNLEYEILRAKFLVSDNFKHVPAQLSMTTYIIVLSDYFMFFLPIFPLKNSLGYMVLISYRLINFTLYCTLSSEVVPMLTTNLNKSIHKTPNATNF